MSVRFLTLASVPELSPPNSCFARPRDFSKLPKTHARKGPRFQWLSELLRVPRQRAARLASVHRVFLPSFFQWNDNPRPFVWTATVDSIQGEALAMSANAGTDTTGLHFAAQKKQKAVSSYFLDTTLLRLEPEIANMLQYARQYLRPKLKESG